MTEINLINQYIDKKLLPQQYIEISEEVYKTKVLGFIPLQKENEYLRQELQLLSDLVHNTSTSVYSPQKSSTSTLLAGTQNLKTSPVRSADTHPLVELPPQILDWLQLSREMNLSAYQEKI